MLELLHVTPALESVWQFRRRVAWNHGAIGTVRAPGWQTRRCPNGATCRPVRCRGVDTSHREVYA